MVLIVDDDAVFRQLARELLVSAGFDEISEAAGLAEANAAVARRRPDAVLLDLHLPDGDGLVLARELNGVARVLLTSTEPSVGRDPGVAFVSKVDLPRADLHAYLG